MSATTSARRKRALAVFMMSSALLSACGLKPEVKDQLAQSGGVGGGGFAAGSELGADGTTLDPLAGGEAGGIDPVTGQPVTGDPAAGGTTAGGAPGTTTTGGGGGGGGGGGAAPAGGGGGGAAAPAAPAKGGNRTGIDDGKKVINIALHGPLTGAGVPQESFRSGTTKYWEGGRKLANGYTVNAVALDDKYNAADAARPCAEAAGKFFLVVGGAGTDQIQSCGQQQKMQAGKVPYLSSGVTENGLGNLPNYFATSLTYKQQGPLVVRAAQEMGYFGGRWAVVITDTPNFADARASITDALKKAGAKGKAGAFNPATTGGDVILTDKAPRDCASQAGQLRGNYDVIYFLGQPSFFLQCVGQIGPGPTYTGPGPSFGVNSVGGLACDVSGGTYKGFYLHPVAGIDQAAQRAPGVNFKDDIEFSIYAAMQGLERAFNQVQGNLSRETFTATLAKSQIPGGIAPPAIYNGGSRFGGTTAYLLKSDCSDKKYNTVKEYKTR